VRRRSLRGLGDDREMGRRTHELQRPIGLQMVSTLTPSMTEPARGYMTVDRLGCPPVDHDR
jgi:hypothetical protein